MKRYLLKALLSNPVAHYLKCREIVEFIITQINNNIYVMPEDIKDKFGKNRASAFFVEQQNAAFSEAGLTPTDIIRWMHETDYFGMKIREVRRADFAFYASILSLIIAILALLL